MKDIERDLHELINRLNLKERAFDALENLKKAHIESGELIDGYSLTELKFLFERFEIRIEREDDYFSTLIARINILESNIENQNKNEQESIGYYDYVVGFNGNFIDEFFVLKKGKDE